MRETAKSRQAWADYLALGVERSLAKLAAIYHQNDPETTPDNILRQLKRWSSAHGWQVRLEALAAEAEAAAEAVEAERVRAIMATGYALDHGRVELLKELTATLVAELRGDRLWLRDKKSIITGQEPIYNDEGTAVIGSTTQYEVFDLERPNSAWVTQVRGLLADIADETGGRVKTTKTELTGKDGGAVRVEHEDTTPLDQRLADVAAIFQAASGRPVG